MGRYGTGARAFALILTSTDVKTEKSHKIQVTRCVDTKALLFLGPVVIYHSHAFQALREPAARGLGSRGGICIVRVRPSPLIAWQDFAWKSSAHFPGKKREGARGASLSVRSVLSTKYQVLEHAPAS